ncbi:MAG: phosphoglycolate phosphatase [Comamonadaceae bacterium]|nr:MAG: phosphoglycolate phosphatase [Comamonadaceae bacterium]
MTLRLSQFDAVMVDLDGTLIDTMGDFDIALQRMLAELGLPHIASVEIERRIGKGSEYLIRSVLSYALGLRAASAGEPMPPDDAVLDDFFVRGWPLYQAHYLAVNGANATVYPGVTEGLQLLRSRGLRMACLTNKPTAFALPLLAAKSLDGYFDVVFGGDAFERRKPDPMPLLKTCEALHSTPARTLMLGDSSNDAQAARGAGCPVLLMTYGYNHGAPIRGVDADGFLDSMADLARLG